MKCVCLCAPAPMTVCVVCSATSLCGQQLYCLFKNEVYIGTQAKKVMKILQKTYSSARKFLHWHVMIKNFVHYHSRDFLIKLTMHAVTPPYLVSVLILLGSVLRYIVYSIMCDSITVTAMLEYMESEESSSCIVATTHFTLTTVTDISFIPWIKGEDSRKWNTKFLIACTSHIKG